MTTRKAAATLSSAAEEDSPLYFSEWLKRRRKDLDLTQAQLAHTASCTVFTIRKIETGERRPSRQLAELLAKSLGIPPEDQTTFIKVARGELGVERLASPVGGSSSAEKPAPTPINLPRPLTPFIGREPELTALAQLLQDPQCPLLTIVGPGGIGKTRLAIEAAYHSRDLFPDGIWFVPLASLNSPALILPAIAEAVDFKFQDPTDPQTQLLRYLHPKKALLLLDNAEHLLEGVGVLTEILKDCQQMKLLVTSRERLDLLSEWVFEIQGLPVPPNDQVEQFEEYSATALFLQSARRVRLSFALREAERRWVLKICQAMEGMPLGIELSAAWVGLLSMEAIAKEIEDNLDFLSVSMRDLPERHRSLRATLDHSWKLLTPGEKLILSRLAVFHGRFSLEAAQEICGASLPVLSSLRNKSLLHRTDQDDYGLHEIIHQYAALRLAEDAGEDERVKDRHALYYAQRLSEWEQALKSSRQVETLTEMELEIDNLRQAWQRMISYYGIDGNKNILFSQNLFRSSLFSLSLFFELRCRYWEAVDLFSQAVDTLKAARKSASGTEDIQSIDSFLGLVMAYLGYQQYLMHYVQAPESLTEALHLLENDASGKARAQIMLGWFYQAQGQYQKAADLFQKSLVSFQQENEQWWYTISLIFLAGIYLVKGNIPESVALFQESLRRIEPGDLRQGVLARTLLGYAYFFLGDYPEAERLLQESLELSYRLGNKRQVAYNHRLLGQVFLASGQSEQAHKHFQECLDLFAGYGESPDLALGLIYFGKGLTARLELEAARETFRKVIKIGQTLNVFYLVYWGLVNLARIILLEGQPEKALEMMLILQQYSVEPKVAQDDSKRLLEELQAKFSKQQVEGTMERIKGLAVDSLLDQT